MTAQNASSRRHPKLDLGSKSSFPFIVIEALDAGGSQTQTDWLVEHLKKDNKEPLALHFPQEDRATGRMVYDKFLLHQNKHPFSIRERALLYILDFYSRNEDIANALVSQPVVSDRYCTSTFVYQTTGLTGDKRKNMMEWLTWLCYGDKPKLHTPNMVVFIDTPVSIVMKRLKSKKKDFHETEKKLLAFRQSYLRVAKEQKWTVVNGVDEQGKERTREDIHNEIWQLVEPLVS